MGTLNNVSDEIMFNQPVSKGVLALDCKDEVFVIVCSSAMLPLSKEIYILSIFILRNSLIANIC